MSKSGLSERAVVFFSSRRRHTISLCDWSSDVCSSDLRQGVKVPDPRLDALAPLFEPKKFTPAEVQYVDVAGIVRGSGQESAGALLAHLRNTDVLLQVVRAFGSAASHGTDPTPLEDVDAVAMELI